MYFTAGVVQDGESNWLEGVMLIVAYCIIAIVFWFDNPAGGGGGGALPSDDGANAAATSINLLASY